MLHHDPLPPRVASRLVHREARRAGVASLSSSDRARIAQAARERLASLRRRLERAELLEGFQEAEEAISARYQRAAEIDRARRSGTIEELRSALQGGRILR